MYQKFNSVHDLRPQGCLRSPVLLTNPITHEAPTPLHRLSPQEGSDQRFPPSSPFCGSSAAAAAAGPFGERMTPGSSVPCFRRYHHRDNLDEWEAKRVKMLEYQAMLDQQTQEIARRKAEEKERKRREDAALERKLQEQREPDFSLHLCVTVIRSGAAGSARGAGERETEREAGKSEGERRGMTAEKRRKGFTGRSGYARREADRKGAKAKEDTRHAVRV